MSADFQRDCPHCGEPIEAQISLNSEAQISLKLVEANLSIGSKDLKLNQGKKRYNQSYSPQFERFWSAYPLHRGKANAFKAWLKSTSDLSLKIASKTGLDPETAREQAEAEILAGALRYAAEGHEPSKTKYAEGWLSGERWEDEPLQASNGERSIYERLGVDLAAFEGQS